MATQKHTVHRDWLWLPQRKTLEREPRILGEPLHALVSKLPVPPLNLLNASVCNK